MVVPYKKVNLEKKKQVELMFDNISNNYDSLNHFLSLGIDRIWRKKAISQLKNLQPSSILDVATGTGDLAIQAYKTLKTKNITGIDISSNMLEIGINKILSLGLEKNISLEKGDAENLRFSDNSFDAVMVAFGVRNFQNLEKGLDEIYRVLKPNGKLVVLEFSNPKNATMNFFYNLYFKKLLPILGKIFSKDHAAYSYLPESVANFPNGDDFLTILKKSGYNKTECINLTYGVASIYLSVKY